MPSITFSDQTLACDAGDTVLETLLSAGLDVPYSCQTGACQTCLMKATSGAVPSKAQNGLKESLKPQGYFLACQCEPEEDMQISAADAVVRQSAEVLGHEKLTEKILKLRLKRPQNFSYIPGQYLTVWKDAANGRSYSLASVPTLDDHVLELHIRKVEGGVISSWLYDQVKPGDHLEIQDAIGHCCYTPTEQEDPILLAGAGTGLAPLIGIARDALQQEHRGEIHLFHAARDHAGLYLDSELQALAQQHKNFHYHPVIESDSDTENQSDQIRYGELNQLVLDFIDDPKVWRYFLCGAEKRVTTLRKKLFLSGAAMKNIYADAFVLRATG